MIIGVPKEIKDHEFRVGLTPGGAQTLVKGGHRVLVEAGAGVGSGLEDDAYRAAGADVIPEKAVLFERADLIVKVKEPLESEYSLFRKGQALFTYLHLAANRKLTEALLERQVFALAYETVERPDRSLPILQPMSEVAGRLSAQIGAHYLERTQGGRGILLGGVPGVAPGKVVVLGAGVVGTQAIRVAVGLGAQVTVFNLDRGRLEALDALYQGRIVTMASDPTWIEEAVLDADLVIGAVMVTGARAPILVKRGTVKRMKKGAVIVDVSVDQGGCVETTRPTSHSEPVYIVDGVLHYAVPNIPGIVPHTATFALTNASLPFILRLAELGPEQAVRTDPVLAKGLNLADGRVTCRAVAEALGMPFTP
ncbi:MAG TPA: alanine dehydrogenase [Nitrospirales bacterium]|jgi:alanine dehydrogenase|nr:alanine dehydrogenase [Nitrospirales bacterium]